MNEWKIKGKPGLVILHMQEGVVGSMVREDRAREVRDSDHLPHQQALLKAFREKNLPVIYVNLNMPKDRSLLPSYGMFGQIISQAKGAEPPSENPKRLEVIPQLAPQPGEPILFNWFFSAFAHSGLDEELKKRNVDTTVFFGGALHIAVFNATVAASDLSYSVIVPQDACIPTVSANKTPEAIKTREAFLSMFNMYALVTTADDIISHL